jgi:hypothetical protein
VRLWSPLRARGLVEAPRPLRDGIMAGRACRHVARIDVLTPTERRGRPQLPLQVERAPGDLENRRAVVKRRAAKGLWLPLRDSRLKAGQDTRCDPHRPVRHEAAAAFCHAVRRFLFSEAILLLYTRRTCFKNS